MADESFTNIDPSTLPPELQGTYKSMQADYTRKRQEEANRLKEAELRAQQIEQEYGNVSSALNEYKRANDAWVQWSQQVADINPADPDGGDGDPTYEMPGQGRVTVKKRSDSERAILKQEQELNSVKEQLSKVSTALDMALQIDDLRHKYPNLDPKKVIDVALQMKIPDLNQARDIAYREEDFRAAVDSEVAAKVKEELERARTTVLDGEGAPPFEIFKHMPERHASFEETTENILKNLKGSLGSI
jgi:hypothetical protein